MPEEKISENKKTNKKILIGLGIAVLIVIILAMIYLFVNGNEHEETVDNTKDNIVLQSAETATKPTETATDNSHLCGNSICDDNEIVDGRVYCERDCIPNCGNGVCEPPEDYRNCGDCEEYVVDICGNGRCESGEEITCPQDCKG